MPKHIRNRFIVLTLLILAADHQLEIPVADLRQDR